jgi:hypothetical protein
MLGEEVAPVIAFFRAVIQQLAKAQSSHRAPHPKYTKTNFHHGGTEKSLYRKGREERKGS